MKRVMLIVTAVLVLVLGIISCAQTQAPPPDIPRYTADQVIAVAKAGAINPLTPFYREKTDELWSAEYIKYGVWRLKREFVLKRVGSLYSVDWWQFNEDTGKLIKLQ